MKPLNVATDLVYDWYDLERLQMASPVLDSYLDGFVRGFFPFSHVAEYSQLKTFFVVIIRFNFKMVFKFYTLSCKFYIYFVLYCMIKKEKLFKKHALIVRQLSTIKRIWLLISVVLFLFCCLFFFLIQSFFH